MKTRKEEVTLALEALQRGEVVALPTDTVYGLVADPWNEKALQKIYQLKGRSPDKPLVLFVSSIDQAKTFSEFDSRAEKLATSFWPGALTLVLKASEKSPGLIVTPRGTIGLRFPDAAYVKRIIEELGKPLASTSANPSGYPPFISREEVLTKWENLVTVIGETSLGKVPSTVLDISRKEQKILRKGGIPIIELEKTLGGIITIAPPLTFKLLFVCTGNTCRSPMAEWILRHLLKGYLKNRVTIDSCGTRALPGMPIDPNAYIVLKEMGISPGFHQSKPINEELLTEADWILCMENIHIEHISELHFGLKCELLGGDEIGEIPDPIGHRLPFYRRICETIKASIERRVIPKIQQRIRV